MIDNLAVLFSSTITSFSLTCLFDLSPHLFGYLDWVILRDNASSIYIIKGALEATKVLFFIQYQPRNPCSGSAYIIFVKRPRTLLNCLQ